ncbi:MAG: FkbM family methyltransferase [Gemmataceae bacterium]|nr:FkbM family methyltransferase [Gemmataceae bacterium]
MKQIEGIWLPDEDTHFQTMFPQFPKVGGKATYQYDKVQACLAHCLRRRVAVDVGAHVGLWSMILCDHFAKVIAFEPVFAKHFRRNLEGKPNVLLHEVALSDRPGNVEMEIVGYNSGATHIAKSPTGGGKQITAARLDDYRLDEVDLIKVDVEGWEYQVLRGAEETLLRNRPLVILEQKGYEKEFYGFSHDCVEHMQTLGARVLETKGKDILMGWGNAGT